MSRIDEILKILPNQTIMLLLEEEFSSFLDIFIGVVVVDHFAKLGFR